eukprot:jgi/Galph1/1701/GphlegSOOS_G396.1
MKSLLRKCFNTKYSTLYCHFCPDNIPIDTNTLYCHQCGQYNGFDSTQPCGYDQPPQVIFRSSHTSCQRINSVSSHWLCHSCNRKQELWQEEISTQLSEEEKQAIQRINEDYKLCTSCQFYVNERLSSIQRNLQRQLFNRQLETSQALVIERKRLGPSTKNSETQDLLYVLYWSVGCKLVNGWKWICCGDKNSFWYHWLKKPCQLVVFVYQDAFLLVVNQKKWIDTYFLWVYDAWQWIAILWSGWIFIKSTESIVSFKRRTSLALVLSILLYGYSEWFLEREHWGWCLGLKGLSLWIDGWLWISMKNKRQSNMSINQTYRNKPQSNFQSSLNMTHWYQDVECKLSSLALQEPTWETKTKWTTQENQKKTNQWMPSSSHLFRPLSFHCTSFCRTLLIMTSFFGIRLACTLSFQWISTLFMLTSWCILLHVFVNYFLKMYQSYVHIVHHTMYNPFDSHWLQQWRHPQRNEFIQWCIQTTCIGYLFIYIVSQDVYAWFHFSTILSQLPFDWRHWWKQCYHAMSNYFIIILVFSLLLFFHRHETAG